MMGCSADGNGSASASTASCADVVCIPSLPTTQSGSTLGATRNSFDVYGCAAAAGADLSGGEVVHRMTLPHEGFLSVAKTSGPTGSLVLLLRSDDATSCIDAHATNVGAWLPAGDYFAVVDGPSDSPGDFTLSAAVTTPDDLTAVGVDVALAADALSVYRNAWAWGATRRSEYVIVDFRLHSALPREWVWDFSTGQLLWHLRVAHGRKSTDGLDLAHAVTFSNVPGSNQSSLGLARSAGTYTGTFGPSFRLEGLEPGFNDNICGRDIVMHPWAPVGDEYVQKCGWARPSLGCPAMDEKISLPVRNRLARPDGAALQAGVLMLYWSPNTDWHASSELLRGVEPSPELLAQMQVECDSSQDGTPQTGGTYACD